MGKLFGLVFGVGFSAGGLTVCAIFTLQIWRWVDSMDWIVVPATIDTLDLRVTTDESTTYRVECTYHYSVAGRKYSGDRPSLYTGSDNIGSFQQQLYDRLSAARRQGRTVDCYVDAVNPKRSILDRTLRPGMIAFELIFVVLFGSIGLSVLAYMLALRRPREVYRRIRIDSDARPIRAAARVAGLYNGAVATVAVPVTLICMLAGQWVALLTAIVVALPVAACFLSLRYAWRTRAIVGSLFLPERWSERASASVEIPATWNGPSELSAKWDLPRPPSNQLRLDEDEEMDCVELKTRSGSSMEIEVPMPPPMDEDWKPESITLEIKGTIDSQPYEDTFSIPGEVIERIRAS